MANLRQAQLKLYTVILALAMVAGAAARVQAATASWDPNTEPDLAGYKLSYGTQPGVHTTVIDVGNVTTYHFNPAPGLRYYVVVQAYNTAGELSENSSEAIIDLSIPVANSAPTLAQPANQSSTVKTNVSLQLSASDSDGNALHFSATGLPPGLSIDSVSGLIAGTTGAAASYQVTVAVSDGVLSATRSFGWAVVDAPASNRPPTLTQPQNQTSTVSTNVSLNLSASDPDGNALRFTASGLPQGLSIDRTSGRISGSARSVGAYVVAVNVSDGTLSASATFTWSIVDASTPPNSQIPNRQHVLAQPPDQITTVNATVLLALSASHPEGKPLKFSATGLPPGLSVNSNSGVISGTARTAGVYVVTVSASHGGVAASAVFNWTVVAASSSATASDRDSDSVETIELAPDAGADRGPNRSTVQDHQDVSGDFDGDGRLDLATYRASTGEWRIWTSGSNFSTPTVMVWGAEGDVPAPADYNGDRVTDLAFYRPSTGTWHVWLSGTGSQLAVKWGGAEDKPVALDHDADGKADLALIRNGGFEILLSSSNYLRSVQVF